MPLVAQPGLAPSLRPPYRVRDRLFAGTTVGFPGFPRRMGEGGFQTRAYRRERLSASTIAYRRADTWVRPYGWSRTHPSPARQGGSNPRLQAGTAVRQHHRLPAGGHVGPPLRLVTRASLSRPSRGGGQTRAYRRERLSASTIAYRRADTWVRPYRPPVGDGAGGQPFPPVGAGLNPPDGRERDACVTSRRGGPTCPPAGRRWCWRTTVPACRRGFDPPPLTGGRGMRA